MVGSRKGIRCRTKLALRIHAIRMGRWERQGFPTNDLPKSRAALDLAPEVGEWVRKVVTGYYRYHAIPGNIDRLSIFGQRLRRLWCSLCAAAVSNLYRGIGSVGSSHAGFQVHAFCMLIL